MSGGLLPVRRTGMETDILPIRRGQQGYARSSILKDTVCSLSVDPETGCGRAPWASC
jgi:hypothetical protein